MGVSHDQTKLGSRAHYLIA